MKSYIIGINGKAGSGKDTIASMINYIFTVGISRANYADYLIKRRTIDIEQKDRIIHFADNLKNVLSIMFNIKREYFDAREYKDEYYYNIDTNKFISEKDVNDNRSSYFVINNAVLEEESLNDIINADIASFRIIKLRNLMQYFGTDVCRKYVSDDVWIRSAMYNIIDKARARRLCIIPDVRFDNEHKAISVNRNDIKSALIVIDRCVETGNHESEKNIDNMDYLILNNGTLTNLFYKVLTVCEQIIK